MVALDDLGLKHGTDKSSAYHDYLRQYEPFLAELRPRHVLEVGVLRGASLRLWREYFGCEVYGIDCDPACYGQEAEGIHIRIGDQEDPTFLNRVCEEITPSRFRLIVDDASHRARPTIAAFQALFPKLDNGGVYIMEDTCCSYWAEFNPPGEPTPIEFCKDMVDRVHLYGYRPGTYARAIPLLLRHQPELARDFPIESVTFINGSVIFRKRS